MIFAPFHQRKNRLLTIKTFLFLSRIRELILYVSVALIPSGSSHSSLMESFLMIGSNNRGLSLLSKSAILPESSSTIWRRSVLQGRTRTSSTTSSVGKAALFCQKFGVLCAIRSDMTMTIDERVLVSSAAEYVNVVY